MRVKVHPHKTRVNSGLTLCVSVTPIRRGGRARYYAYVFLKDASFTIYQGGVQRAQREQRRNVHAWAVGELVCTRDNRMADVWFQDGDWEKVTYHYNIGRFVTMDGVDVTDKNFTEAACNGRDFYVRVR